MLPISQLSYDRGFVWTLVATIKLGICTLPPRWHHRPRWLWQAPGAPVPSRLTERRPKACGREKEGTPCRVAGSSRARDEGTSEVLHKKGTPPASPWYGAMVCVTHCPSQREEVSDILTMQTPSIPGASLPVLCHQSCSISLTTWWRLE